MQRKDIKIGAEYAEAENYQWNGSRYSSSPRTANRVKVLAVGVARDVYASGSYRPHAVNNGVEVEYLEGRRKGDKGIVTTARIRQEWAPYAEQAAKTAKSMAEHKVSRIENTKSALADITAALGDTEVTLPWAVQRAIEDVERTPSTVTLSLSEFAAYLTAAHNAGRKA